MDRIDKQMGFVENLEHVGWYENGAVRILDRRIYPIRVEFVVCHHHEEVAQAIADMVTQSGGPYFCAQMGMVLAAYEARELAEKPYLEFLERAAYTLSHARPTTTQRMQQLTGECLRLIRQWQSEGVSRQEIIVRLQAHVVESELKGIERMFHMGSYVAPLIPKNGTIMTQCYASVMVAGILLACRERGNEVKVICPETRPYLQGARLTASMVRQMGFDVTVVSDNMPGYTMKEKHVDLFTAAADVLTQDGYIINKVGTFQIALAARYWGIPFVCTSTPSKFHKDLSTVHIEQRNEQEVLSHLGTKVTLDGVKGFYPAFDITPPKLCDVVATDRGLYSPFDLKSYFLDGGLE